MTKSAAQRVIDDPDNHYPYRRDDAIEAGTPEDVADACERVVEAQRAYLLDPSDETLQARNEAERWAQRVSSEHRPIPDGYRQDGTDEDGFRVLRKVARIRPQTDVPTPAVTTEDEGR